MKYKIDLLYIYFYMNRKNNDNKRKKGKDKTIEKKNLYGKFNSKSIRIEENKKENKKNFQIKKQTIK